MSSFWKYFLGFLLLIAVTVWVAIAAYPKTNLRLIACDVGQGDAILIIYGKTQILVDGGPNNSVIGCISKNLPFWDREIELVVLTHPQADHFSGLIEVFKRYKVEYLLASQIDSSSQSYQVLRNQVGGTQTQVLSPFTGMTIRLGLIYLDIVHPSQDFLSKNAVKTDSKVLGKFSSSSDPNDFSVVANLRLGDFDALLTGDIGPEVSDMIADKLATSYSRTIEYIKVPHHGSKNGLTKKLLEISKPEVAVISVGSNNRYGHPSKEVIKLLRDKRIKIFRTDELGDVEIITDGSKWWLAE